jgi:ElaB/YqjD/DUF883 family membrane-anchored ribosome-binding protein
MPSDYMPTHHDDEPEEIDEGRFDVRGKASEIAARARDAASHLHLREQVEARPWIALAASVAAGFMAGRFLFPHQQRESSARMFFLGDDGRKFGRRKRKKSKKERRLRELGHDLAERVQDNVGSVRETVMEGAEAASRRARQAAVKTKDKLVEMAPNDLDVMSVLSTMGQVAAGALARELVGRLVHRHDEHRDLGPNDNGSRR